MGECSNVKGNGGDSTRKDGKRMEVGCLRAEIRIYGRRKRGIR